jgi:excinuclease ABC subunit C
MLKEKLQRVPRTPGVYLLKDEEGRILYVGKAKSLKDRLSSYFARDRIDDIKTRTLVSQVHDFDIMMVTHEAEALLLERTLIREHQPSFNILLRDDKEYPYIRVDFSQAWPRLEKVRRKKSDGATYVGPFSYASSLQTLLQLCYQIFPLIRCSPREFATRVRPCNYYSMKKCLAPCVLPVEQAIYKEVVDQALDVLRGREKVLLKTLNERMRQAASDLQFERAATLRDQIQALKQIAQSQSMVSDDVKNADIVAYALENDSLSLYVLHVREGRCIGQFHEVIELKVAFDDAVLAQFLCAFYESRTPPAEILLSHTFDDMALVAELLQTRCVVPKIGGKKRLLDIAHRNALYQLREVQNQQVLEEEALTRLKVLFRSSVLPRRMDAMDISHIQGSSTVASVVSFVDGRPAPHLYRLYNLTDQEKGPDDFASMREVMQRYAKRLQTTREVPQVVLVDGGLGQLSAAASVKEQFPDLDFILVSLAKDRVRYRSSDQGQHSEERLFLEGDSVPIVLAAGTVEHRIISHLRDEAHRFAITHHRRRRQGASHASSLDSIPGIGPKTRNAILKRIQSIDHLKTITLEELVAIPGVRRDQAQAIVQFFQKSSTK